MIRSIGLFCVLCLLSILTSCHTTSSTDQDLPPYNPNVEAFTTGKISRYSPVYLIFNQEIRDYHRSHSDQYSGKNKA